MKKFLSMSILMLFICLSFNVDLKIEKTSNIPSISFSTVYAQEDPVNEVIKVNVEMDAASDMEDYKLDIPAWAGSVLMFLQGIPKIGPILVKALSYMGIIAAFLTLLSSFMMGLSGFLAILSKGKKSPDWVKSAKKYSDYGTQYAKYFSMYNVNKDEQKKS